MGIVTSRKERRVGCPGALILPASLSTFQRGWGEGGPQEVQYLHLLDHIYPLIRNSISAWIGGAHSWSRLLGQTSQHFTETFIRLSASRRTERIQHLIHPRRPPPQLDPKLLSNQTKCDMHTPTVHQTLTVVLCLDFCGLKTCLFQCYAPMFTMLGQMYLNSCDASIYSSLFSVSFPCLLLLVGPAQDFHLYKFSFSLQVLHETSCPRVAVINPVNFVTDTI